MFEVFVLSSLLLVSVIGIIAILLYKIIRISGDEEVNTSRGLSVNIIKNKLAYLVEHAQKKCAHVVLSRGKDVYSKAGRHVSGKYSVFTDAMNGRGDTSKKGVASFFLKSVSEHKKIFRAKK